MYSDITVHVFARFAVEKISFLTPLEDVILEHVGVKGVFECEISKKGLKPEAAEPLQKVSPMPDPRRRPR